MTAPAPVVVVLRADATQEIGVGHAMRLLALSQELLARGHAVHLAGDLDIGWVRQAYDEAGVVVHARPATPADLVTTVALLGAHVAVLDRYDLTPAWGASLQAAGCRVVVMVDGPFSADQVGDLYVDQNPGASPRPVGPGQTAIAGARYTLFRDDVLSHRLALGSEGPPSHRPLRVLAVFGGTDPLGAAPVVTPLVLGTGRALELTVISADDAWVDDANEHRGPAQRLDVIPPVTDLAARAAMSDLVVTASGSSVWELLCLGVPLAVVCVIDNQSPGYDMVVREGLAVGLGHLAQLRERDASRTLATDALRGALESAEARGRLAERGQRLLDGRGRERVADAVVALVRSPRTSSP